MAPATPRLIDRGDLVAALDRAAARKVTIISAPAGSGKTSPAARLGRPSGPAAPARRRAGAPRPARRPAVLACPARRDPSGFGDCRPRGTASSDARLQRTGDGRPGAIGARRRSDGVTLVIDDLHELNSPEALAQLARLLTNLPPQVHADIDHAPRSAAAAAPAAPGRRARRDPRGRPALHRAGNPRAARRLGHRAVRGRGGAAAPADRGVGRGPAAGGALPGRSPRPGALRRGVLRQRPHGRRVPDRRDARPPATPTSRTCSCAPPCSIGSTASWPTC